jgi:hypothetical protein
MGVADMTAAKVMFEFTPVSTDGWVNSFTLPAGGWGLVDSIEVRVQGVSEPIEQIRDANRLAYVLQCYDRGSSESAARELKERESSTELFPFINRNTAAASTYATKKVFVDLNRLLGCGKIATWPLQATGGLEIQIVLAAAGRAMQEYILGGPRIPVSATHDGADFTAFTTVPETRPWPRVDFSRAADEHRFKSEGLAEDIVVQGAAAAASFRATVQSIVRSATGGGEVLNIDPVTSAGQAAGTQYIWRDLRVTFDTTDPAAHFDTHADMTVANSPFFAGQSLTTWTRTGGNYASADVTIDTVTQSGNKVRCTFTAPMGAGANREGFIRGTAATNVNYSIAEPRLILPLTEPDDRTVKKMNKALSKGMSLPLLTVMSHRDNHAAGANEISQVIPTPVYLREVLATFTVPTWAGTTAFDLATRGQRDTVQDFRFTVDGISQPAQAIDMTSAYPTIALHEFKRALDEVHAAVADGTAAPESIQDLQRIFPGLQTWAFPKAMGAAGMALDLAGKRLELQVVASSALGTYKASHAAAVVYGTTMSTYVFHVRRLNVSANGLELQ